MIKLPSTARSKCVALFVAAILSLLWLYAEAVPEKRIVTLSSEDIFLDSGCSYISRLSAGISNLFVSSVSDGIGNPEGSSAKLYENAKLLGPAHTPHATIRGEGDGRFSHWDESIYFSASDCSNPKTNGRNYSVELPLSPSFFTRVVGCGAFLMMLATLCSIIYPPPRVYLNNVVMPFIGDTLRSNDDLGSLRSIGLFATLLISLPLIYLIWLWNSGESVSLSLAGFFPISDASGYWTCSNTLLDFGNFGNWPSWAEFCQRRPIYLSWLAGLMVIGDRTIHGVLAVQVAFVSIALALLVRQSTRLTGWAGSVFLILYLLIFFSSNAWPLVMTENTGLVFGLFGVAILLSAAEDLSSKLLLIGCALTSIALNARAGAFFILPLLVIWSVCAAEYAGKRKFIWGIYAVIGCSIGFLLQISIVWITGGNPASSHSSFAYVLYGLSVGGSGWQQVLVDHSQVLNQAVSDSGAAKMIYQWAFSNILSNPLVFLKALLKSLSTYLQLVPTGHDDGVPTYFARLATCLWYLGWIPIWQHRREPKYLLIGFGCLGSVLSAPFLAGDGGQRVFAAGLAFDALQISVGLTWVLPIVFQRVTKCHLDQYNVSPQSRLPDLLFGLLLIFCFVVPYMHRFPVHRNLVIKSPLCAQGSHSVFTKIGYESILMTLTESKAPYVWKGEVNRQDFMEGLPVHAWYTEKLKQFNGRSIILANQINHDGNAFGPTISYFIFSNEDLSQLSGKTVFMCVSQMSNMNIFSATNWKIDSVKVVE